MSRLTHVYNLAANSQQTLDVNIVSVLNKVTDFDKKLRKPKI